MHIPAPIAGSYGGISLRRKRRSSVDDADDPTQVIERTRKEEKVSAEDGTDANICRIFYWRFK